MFIIQHDDTRLTTNQVINVANEMALEPSLKKTGVAVMPFGLDDKTEVECIQTLAYSIGIEERLKKSY